MKRQATLQKHTGEEELATALPVLVGSRLHPSVRLWERDLQRHLNGG